MLPSSPLLSFAPDQSLPTLALFTLGPGHSVLWGHPVHCRTLSRVPGLSLPDAKSTPSFPESCDNENVSKHCQRSPGDTLVRNRLPFHLCEFTPSLSSQPLEPRLGSAVDLGQNPQVMGLFLPQGTSSLNQISFHSWRRRSHV